MSLKVVNDDDNNNPNVINKLNVPQLNEELRTRGLSIIGNKPELKTWLIQYLKYEEALDDTKMN